MTKQEWINDNRDFFHVTQTSNIPSILKYGLKKGKYNPLGICVIRSAHDDILQYLCQVMVITTDELDFSVIRISPKVTNLSLLKLLMIKLLKLQIPFIIIYVDVL